jgi:hypothetical protein
MSSINEAIANYHRLIILALIVVVFFMATSCVFHNIIPICHEIFGCDHKMHMTGTG